MDAKHTDSVKALQEQIADYYKRKVPFRVYHGSTNATRVMTFKRSEMVDISNLNRVLSVDVKNRTAVVEPNVPMDKLVDETLKYGLVPPVVTEFPGITVGGAIQGGAVESGSFKWGCFSQTVNNVEMIIGNGELIVASSEKHADLFYGSAGSYGSLGLINSAEVQLIPAKKYVTISSHPISSFKQALEETMYWAKTDCDFIECGMLRKDCGTLLVGKYSDSVEGKLLRFRRAIDPYYSMYLEKVTEDKASVTATLPLKDYLFRYDRGAFWTAQMAFKQKGLPFNAAIRFILNPLLKTRKLYEAVQASAAAERYICQDIVMPEESLVKFMEFIDKEFNIYPTGFCALKTEPRSPLLFNGYKNTDLVFTVGVYGLRIEPYQKFVEANRLIENKTRELGGRKWFYAHSYYSEKEFWDIYDRHWYEKLRSKYYAITIPDIYSRICVKKEYHVNSKRAVLNTMLGKAKLRIEE